jgi:hypothetical protein
MASRNHFLDDLKWLASAASSEKWQKRCYCRVDVDGEPAPINDQRTKLQVLPFRPTKKVYR